MTPGDPAMTFSALLRAHRREAGLTQAELADLAGLGIRTVRDLEHGRASRPQRTTVELLARALDLSGPVGTQFYAASRGHVVSAEPAKAKSLPRPAELIGRDDEINSLVNHLAGAAGVTTLVGLTGVGKSALALAIPQHMHAYFPAGVGGISVASGDAPTDALEGICAVLAVAQPSQLGRRLAEPVLLLIDGAERSLGAVKDVVQQLMRLSPALRVLVTSRAPLGIPGENVWPVSPLRLPPLETSTVEDARTHPASALFLARWSQVRSQPPADDEVPAMVALVCRLGGLPLAIELAAARGRVLDPQEMLARYGDRLLDLAPGEADSATVSMRDVVTASYRLLDPPQRWALRQLAGFGYRWSIELAEDLLDDELDVVPVLERLVELGMVQVRGTGALRFMLLDVVKAYALEQAAAASEIDDIRRQHAIVFARFAARLAPELIGSRLAPAVARLDDVATDLWGALSFAADHDPETALCLASKLPRWWRFRGRDQQGRQLLLRLLDDPRTSGGDPTVRTWAQLGVAQLALEHGAGREELPRAEEALADFMRTGDVTGELAARAVLLAMHQSVGEYEDARRHGEATLALATRTGRVRDMAVAQNNLIWHDLRSSDLAEAQRRLAAVDRLSARCGEHKLRALARANLAEVLRLDCRYDESVRVGLQAAEMLAEVGNPGERRRLLGVIGLSYALSERFEDATKVLAEIRGFLDELADDWDCAMIEATLAHQRGERMIAASWYAEAAANHDGGADLRDIAEALVGLVATSDEPDAARARLVQLCSQAGITLTKRERKLAEL